MATRIHMPKWGMAMEEGLIVEWLKKEGDRVKKGEDLFVAETEKITNTVEATASGILFKIIVPEGQTARVGEVICIMAEEGETPDLAELINPKGSPPPETMDESPEMEIGARPERGDFVEATPAARRLAAELDTDLSLVEGSGDGGRVTERDVKAFQADRPSTGRVTSLARRIAEQSGVSLSEVEGTGPRGKIVKADVEKVLRNEANASAESIPYRGMRRSIGENMLSSLNNAAQLSAFVEADVTETIELLDQVRREFKQDESVKVSYNDFVNLAVSRALKRHPIMNSTRTEGEILLHAEVNLGMAVSISEGLIVPVIKGAERMGLLQIAQEARRLAAKAREGGLSVEDVSDGTFTVSNTSMIEVDGFTPILRPPETGILGVGRIKLKPAEHMGEIKLRQISVLSLTYDHCVVDGAPAHSFLAQVAKFLQKPGLLSL